MAGINFEKYKLPQQVKAVARHCDKNQRKNSNHSNKNIDKNKTEFNQQGELNYDEFCKKYDEKIRDLDSKPGANRRSDRVTCIGIEIPTPNGLSEDDEAKFLIKCVDLVRKQYGDDNVLQWYAHYDEQHEYTDSETKEKRMSRNHVHVLVVPEVAGKLNAKKATSRSSMIRLNNAVHNMCVDEFGVAFNNGTRKASRKTVEQLKAESEALARKAELDARQKDLDAREKALEVKAEEIRTRDEVSDKTRYEAITIKGEAVKKENALKLQSQELEKKAKEQEARQKDINARLLALQSQETAYRERERRLKASEEEVQVEKEKFAAMVPRVKRVFDTYRNCIDNVNKHMVELDGVYAKIPTMDEYVDWLLGHSTYTDKNYQTRSAKEQLQLHERGMRMRYNEQQTLIDTMTRMSEEDAALARQISNLADSEYQ